MSDDQDKIKALKAATFAIEGIVGARDAGEKPRLFDDNVKGFAKGIGVSVKLAREMMTSPLCEIFQIDMEAKK